MVRTAVMTIIALQRARDELKQALASSQQEARMANRLATYQSNRVQSMGIWVSRALQARMGLKSDMWPWERKNSGAKG